MAVEVLPRSHGALAVRPVLQQAKGQEAHHARSQVHARDHGRWKSEAAEGRQRFRSCERSAVVEGEDRQRRAARRREDQEGAEGHEDRAIGRHARGQSDATTWIEEGVVKVVLRR